MQSHREQIIEDVLIKNYSKYYCLAYGYVHNEADALDIVQEGAYKAILKADTLRSEEYAETWMKSPDLSEAGRLSSPKNSSAKLMQHVKEMCAVRKRWISEML